MRATFPAFLRLPFELLIPVEGEVIILKITMLLLMLAVESMLVPPVPGLLMAKASVPEKRKINKVRKKNPVKFFICCNNVLSKINTFCPKTKNE